MKAKAQTGILLLAMLGACTTPEGPRLPLPTQDVRAPVPPGYVRVVFFNDTIEALNFASGTMRIQLNGQTVPSLYLNHYAQLYLQPGEYELMLEHWDLFQFTDRFRIEITEPATYFRVWTTPLGNDFEELRELPENFPSEFTGGRDANKWPTFEVTPPTGE